MRSFFTETGNRGETMHETCETLTRSSRFTHLRRNEREEKRKEAGREMCDEDRAADLRRGGKMSRECSSEGKKPIHDDNFKTSYPSDFSIKISFLIKLHLPPTTMMIHRHDHDHFVSLLHLHLFING